MSLVNINDFIFVPAFDTISSFFNSPVWSTSNIYYMNSGNPKQAIITSIPKAGTITDIYFNLSQSNTSTTGQPMYVSIQNLDANGNPLGTGSTYGGSIQTYYNGVFNSNGLSQNITLSTPATGVIAGDHVGVVFEWYGSITGNIQLAAASIANNTSYSNRSGLTWIAANTLNKPQISFIYSDGSFASLVPSLDNIVGRTFNLVEYGISINLPFSCNCVGGYFYPHSVPNNNLILFTLYQGTGVLTNVSINTNLIGGSIMLPFIFPVSTKLQINTNYYLTATFSSTSNSVFYAASGHNQNAMTTWPLGSGGYLVSRSNGITWNGSTPQYSNVAWTNYLQEIPPFGLIINQLDDGTSSSGSTNTVTQGRNSLSWSSPGIQFRKVT